MSHSSGDGYHVIKDAPRTYNLTVVDGSDTLFDPYAAYQFDFSRHLGHTKNDALANAFTWLIHTLAANRDSKVDALDLFLMRKIPSQHKVKMLLELKKNIVFVVDEDEDFGGYWMVDTPKDN